MAFFGKISAKEHYALRMLLQFVPTYFGRSSVTLAAIARREGISGKFLEQLVVPFRKAGWLKAQRGRSGGYRLVKNPRTITLQDVVRLIDRDMYVVDCLHDDACCSDEQHCQSRQAWSKVQAALDRTLHNITLAELSR